MLLFFKSVENKIGCRACERESEFVAFLGCCETRALVYATAARRRVEANLGGCHVAMLLLGVQIFRLNSLANCYSTDYSLLVRCPAAPIAISTSSLITRLVKEKKIYTYTVRYIYVYMSCCERCFRCYFSLKARFVFFQENFLFSECKARVSFVRSFLISPPYIYKLNLHFASRH